MRLLLGVLLLTAVVFSATALRGADPASIDAALPVP